MLLWKKIGVNYWKRQSEVTRAIYTEYNQRYYERALQDKHKFYTYWLLTEFVNLVKYRHRQSDAEHPVTPDPLVLNVELKRKLRNFRREGVREFHRTTGCFRHFCS